MFPLGVLGGCHDDQRVEEELPILSSKNSNGELGTGEAVGKKGRTRKALRLDGYKRIHSKS